MENNTNAQIEIENIKFKKNPSIISLIAVPIFLILNTIVLFIFYKLSFSLFEYINMKYIPILESSWGVIIVILMLIGGIVFISYVFTIILMASIKFIESKRRMK